MQSRGASFWQCLLLEVAGDGLATLWRLFGVGNRWFIQQVGTGLGKLAFFRQGRGPVVSSLTVTRTVVWVRGDVVGFRFPSPCLGSSWFPPEGSSGPSSHCVHIRRCHQRIVCCSFGRHKWSVQAEVSLCEVTCDRAARDGDRREGANAQRARIKLTLEVVSCRFPSAQPTLFLLLVHHPGCPSKCSSLFTSTRPAVRHDPIRSQVALCCQPNGHTQLPTEKRGQNGNTENSRRRQ